MPPEKPHHRRYYRHSFTSHAGSPGISHPYESFHECLVHAALDRPSKLTIWKDVYDADDAYAGRKKIFDSSYDP